MYFFQSLQKVYLSHTAFIIFVLHIHTDLEHDYGKNFGNSLGIRYLQRSPKNEHAIC